MYERFCRRSGVQFELLDVRGDVGGCRQAVFIARGKAALVLRGESGGHSIQHVTRSRNKDRIHTSTATVAVLPLSAEQGEFKLDPREVRVDTFRGSGKGGQHRNVTDSAVRAVHLPTGEMATVTSGRSQGQNRERALEVLGARVAALADSEHRAELERARNRQVRASKAECARTYDLVRDMVRCGSGRKVRGVRRVLDGGLEPVLGE